MDSSARAAVTGPLPLSSDSQHIFEDLGPSNNAALEEERPTDAEFDDRYDIQRTVSDILGGHRRRIALQFPDNILCDAPRVFNRLRDSLRQEKARWRTLGSAPTLSKTAQSSTPKAAVEVDYTGTPETPKGPSGSPAARNGTETVEDEEKLFVLADTSYGSCCVDEIAAEHSDADIVVHYGRSCMSPTKALPVLYVYPSSPLDPGLLVDTIAEEITEKKRILLMCDPAYLRRLPGVQHLLRERGYQDIFLTEPVSDNDAPIPNRRVIPDRDEELSAEALREYTVIHIGNPPTALLLTLQSRAKTLYIYTPPTSTCPVTLHLSTATPQLRRRYALLSRVPALGTIGILLASPTHADSLRSLAHCQTLIKAAGKKSYAFVVGKVNPAKLANFAEIDIWVVVGCWETSLVEGEGFYRGMITVWELELGLKGDKRQWAGEWGVVGGRGVVDDAEVGGEEGDGDEVQDRGSGEDSEPESAPPEFDLKTGQLISTTRSRPTALSAAETRSQKLLLGAGKQELSTQTVAIRSGGQLLHRRRAGELSSIKGAFSPGAAALQKKSWRGLGTDWVDVGYELEAEVVPAKLEEGRTGLARGYTVGDGVQEAR